MSLIPESLEEILDNKLTPLRSSLNFLNARHESPLKTFKEQCFKSKELSSENSALKVEICS